MSRWRTLQSEFRKVAQMPALLSAWQDQTNGRAKFAASGPPTTDTFFVVATAVLALANEALKCVENPVELNLGCIPLTQVK